MAVVVLLSPSKNLLIPCLKNLKNIMMSTLIHVVQSVLRSSSSSSEGVLGDDSCLLLACGADELVRGPFLVRSCSRSLALLAT